MPSKASSQPSASVRVLHERRLRTLAEPRAQPCPLPVQAGRALCIKVQVAIVNHLRDLRTTLALVTVEATFEVALRDVLLELLAPGRARGLLGYEEILVRFNGDVPISGDVPEGRAVTGVAVAAGHATHYILHDS
eukprot:CAMPEP_0115501240 /NCGR_PEP_ID=MMETSP0271-20121206/68289_1 /TAXON_ID=71861 /ORGANISM="Scrippsiella trochoidea, Strain CCMP3099" /LENGTH=134 /DNA_ID=CAMNT_0002930155 /DNA_START=585 /DNA_END=989 /DNA_ORIENTATION=+